MKTQVNTAVDEREQWRARIVRALQELQGIDDAAGDALARDEPDDAASKATQV